MDIMWLMPWLMQQVGQISFRISQSFDKVKVLLVLELTEESLMTIPSQFTKLVEETQVIKRLFMQLDASIEGIQFLENQTLRQFQVIEGTLKQTYFNLLKAMELLLSKFMKACSEIQLKKSIGLILTPIWLPLLCIYYSILRISSKIKKQLDNFNSKPLLSWSELQNLRKQNKSIKNVFLRTTCKASFQVNETVVVTKSQIQSNSFPLLQHIQKLQQRIKDQNSLEMKNKLISIESGQISLRCPTILNNNLITYSVKYEPAKKSFFKKKSLDTVIITASLITNTPLILCCNVENGNIFVRCLGLTKEDIINHFAFPRDRTRTLIIGLLGVGMSLGLGAIWYQFIGKQWFKSLKKWFCQKKNPKKYEIEQVGVNQACIICFTRCRNIVFDKCKHLLVCDICANDMNNPIARCPACREEVSKDRYIPVLQQQKSFWKSLFKW